VKDKCFSNDLYKDLHITDLKAEYVKTKNELGDYESLVGNTTKTLFIKESQHSKHTMQALKVKLLTLKTVLSQHLQDVKIRSLNDTI
jgi:hypothetical protein